MSRAATAAPATTNLLFVLDLAGSFVFAVEGAVRAIGAGLDVFGVMVLAFATALGGGMIRDVLLGATPPAALRDWRYAGIAFLGGLIAIALQAGAVRVPGPVVMWLDAAGLTLFAIAGAEKALAAGVNALAAVLLGMITGVGGGTLRDMLLAQVPAVLRVDVYATAALAGAAVMVVGVRLRLPRSGASALGAITCFGLRVVAATFHWNLPHPQP